MRSQLSEVEVGSTGPVPCLRPGFLPEKSSRAPFSSRKSGWVVTGGEVVGAWHVLELLIKQT